MKMKQTVTLKLQDLRSALLCTANKDVRFYLEGVYVGKGMVAATNGHIALICESESLDHEIIIPKVSIKSFLLKTGTKHCDVQLSQLEDGLYLLHYAGEMELFKPIDGKYPDISRVDIKKPTDINFKQYPNFDIEYMAVFSKIGKIQHKTPVFMPTTENNVAYIDFSETVHGLLMPRRI